jgi:Asp-tRNA(Asn)/Glu-tRNA(Gln) amidotransferase A subunit family amidase
MLLREKCLRAREDPETAWAKLALQHGKAVTENSFYKDFIKIFDLPSREAFLGREGPLFGASFAAKDVFSVRGRASSLGIQPSFLPAAEKDSLLIAQLEQGGAVPVGLTNFDELGLDHYGRNLSFGNMSNPVDPALSPLGSSSGSAIAVARGHADFTLGTDFGGSVRLPAAACGICGFKPGMGFLSSEGVFLLSDSLDFPGILTRSLEDLIFVIEGLKEQPALQVELRDSTFVVPQASQLAEIDSTTAEMFSSLVEVLKGTSSVSLLDEHFSFSKAVESRKLLAIEHAAAKLAAWEIPETSLSDSARALLAFNDRLSATQRAAALCHQQEVAVMLEKLFSRSAILLTPSLPGEVPAAAALSSPRDSGPALNYFLAAANLCGLPAISFPTRIMQGKVPFSVQMVASSGSEFRLTEVALAASRALSAPR